jgi:hypothetical protein
MWEFRDIKQNRTLYAQANSNPLIRIQTVEQLISRYSKQPARSWLLLQSTANKELAGG